MNAIGLFVLGMATAIALAIHAGKVIAEHGPLPAMTFRVLSLCAIGLAADAIWEPYCVPVQNRLADILPDALGSMKSLASEVMLAVCLLLILYLVCILLPQVVASTRLKRQIAAPKSAN
jgi:hypothetical protein